MSRSSPLSVMGLAFSLDSDAVALIAKATAAASARMMRSRFMPDSSIDESQDHRGAPRATRGPSSGRYRPPSLRAQACEGSDLRIDRLVTAVRPTAGSGQLQVTKVERAEEAATLAIEPLAPESQGLRRDVHHRESE